jgi:hypothetical protein
VGAAHHTKSINVDDVKFTKDSVIAKLPVIGGIVGLAGIGGAYALGQENHQFYFSYLTAFAYFLSIALGGLFFVLIQFATRAGWSVVIRRIAEQVMGTLPIFVLLFIPVVFGMHDLYHWTHAELYDPSSDKFDSILAGKQGYLNESFFLIRAGFYLIVWVALSQYFLKKSIAQDKSGDQTITAQLQKWSALGLALYALTQSFAAFDWLMSLDPHWYSTMYGVYFFAGSFVAIFAVLAIFMIGLSRPSGVLHGIATVEHRHDLGKLLFGFTVFWAYIAFSQYFLIWYANIPEETLFYAHRMESGWMKVSIFLMVGHFGVPFCLLMSRHMKRSRKALTALACWMLFMHYVDLYYLIIPNNLAAHGFHPSIVDLLAFVGVGGFFAAMLGWRLMRAAAVPVQDPRLPESLAFENF